MLSANEIEPGQGASAELMFLVRIPMRDGLHLAANIFLPRHRTGPVPALVELTRTRATRRRPTATASRTQGSCTSWPTAAAAATRRASSTATRARSATAAT